MLPIIHYCFHHHHLPEERQMLSLILHPFISLSPNLSILWHWRTFFRPTSHLATSTYTSLVFWWSWNCHCANCASRSMFASHATNHGCALRRLRGRRGFTRQPENSKRAHLRAPALQKHHQNSTRRHPDRHKKSEMVVGEGKKSAKFWAPTLRGPPFGAPFSWDWGPTLRGPPFQTWQVWILLCFIFILLFCFMCEEGHHTETLKLAKVGLAKVGQIFFGQSRFGQSRSNKDGQSRFGQSRSQPNIHDLRVCFAPNDPIASLIALLTTAWHFFDFQVTSQDTVRIRRGRKPQCVPLYHTRDFHFEIQCHAWNFFLVLDNSGQHHSWSTKVPAPTQFAQNIMVIIRFFRYSSCSLSNICPPVNASFV